MFCDRMDVEKPQRVPLFSFSALWDVSAPGARGSEPRRATRSIFLVCNFFKKKIFEKFSSFDYCKRILGTWKSFCYFWALDMAPTWAGPGLLNFHIALWKIWKIFDDSKVPLMMQFWAIKQIDASFGLILRKKLLLEDSVLPSICTKKFFMRESFSIFQKIKNISPFLTQLQFSRVNVTNSSFQVLFISLF